MTGFSKRNIFYCRRFYLFYSGSSLQQAVALKEIEPDSDIVQQLVAPKNDDSVQQTVRLENLLSSIPWGHHVVLINKMKDPDEALLHQVLCLELVSGIARTHGIHTPCVPRVQGFLTTAVPTQATLDELSFVRFAQTGKAFP